MTRSYVAVADQIWNTFLKEVAPQVKSAELIAEDKARQKIQSLQMNTSTYYETRTSKRWDKASFDWESGVCTHTITIQMCVSYKRKGLFGGRRCVAWSAPIDAVAKIEMLK